MSLTRRQLPRPFFLWLALLHAGHARLLTQRCASKYRAPFIPTTLKSAPLGQTPGPGNHSFPKSVGYGQHHLDSISQSGHLQDALHWDHPIFHKSLCWFFCLTQSEALFWVLNWELSTSSKWLQGYIVAIGAKVEKVSTMKPILSSWVFWNSDWGPVLPRLHLWYIVKYFLLCDKDLTSLRDSFLESLHFRTWGPEHRSDIILNAKYHLMLFRLLDQINWKSPCDCKIIFCLRCYRASLLMWIQISLIQNKIRYWS